MTFEKDVALIRSEEKEEVCGIYAAVASVVAAILCCNYFLPG